MNSKTLYHKALILEEKNGALERENRSITQEAKILSKKIKFTNAQLSKMKIDNKRLENERDNAKEKLASINQSLYYLHSNKRRRGYHEVIHETPIVNFLSQVIDSLYDFIPVEETDCAWMMRETFGILYNTGFNNWRRFANQENIGKPGWKCIKSVASKSMETVDRRPIDAPKSFQACVKQAKCLIQLFVPRQNILIIASV